MVDRVARLDDLGLSVLYEVVVPHPENEVAVHVGVGGPAIDAPQHCHKQRKEMVTTMAPMASEMMKSLTAN